MTDLETDPKPSLRDAISELIAAQDLPELVDGICVLSSDDASEAIGLPFHEIYLRKLMEKRCSGVDLYSSARFSDPACLRAAVTESSSTIMPLVGASAIYRFDGVRGRGYDKGIWFIAFPNIVVGADDSSGHITYEEDDPFLLVEISGEVALNDYNSRSWRFRMRDGVEAIDAKSPDFVETYNALVLTQLEELFENLTLFSQETAAAAETE